MEKQNWSVKTLICERKERVGLPAAVWLGRHGPQMQDVQCVSLNQTKESFGHNNDSKLVLLYANTTKCSKYFISFVFSHQFHEVKSTWFRSTKNKCRKCDGRKRKFLMAIIGVNT